MKPPDDELRSKAFANEAIGLDTCFNVSVFICRFLQELALLVGEVCVHSTANMFAAVIILVANVRSNLLCFLPTLSLWYALLCGWGSLFLVHGTTP